MKYYTIALISALTLTATAAQSSALPCTISYEEYRIKLIKAGFHRTRCWEDNGYYYWNELCKGQDDKYPYAWWTDSDTRQAYKIPVKIRLKDGLCVPPDTINDWRIPVEEPLPEDNY